MGKKNNRRRGPARDRDAPGNGTWTQDVASAGPTAFTSVKFEAYYRAQHILPEAEWPAFLEALRRPLPSSFRVTGSRQTAALVNDLITRTHADHLQSVEVDGEPVAPPKQIAWYPDGLAWQFAVPKAVLRKNPEFRKFQAFLVYETEVGNVSRQEAVSMIPPLLLDVLPHHRVLDMCAAPGSKTAQLLEALHALDPTGGAPPPGLLIANDSDTKRAHLLIHQSARLPSPAFAVTNLDASQFPALTLPPATGPNGTPDLGAKRTPLLFDRILCDVPCAGDGTLRKNAGIWAKWTPQDGAGLHALQLRILLRALRLLRPGGRLVYSTCSLNPAEDEAVVAGALREVGAGAALVDVADRLPGLVRRPGMRNWTPSSADKGKEVHCVEGEAFEAYRARVGASARLARSHFPPTAEEAEQMQLERCMRIYPHDQDTGGFFVAVLEKAGEPEPAPASAAKRAAEDEAKDEPEGKRAKLDEPDAAIDDEPLEADEQAVAAPAEASAPPVRPAKDKAAGAGDTSYKEAPFTFLAPSDPNVVACAAQLALLPAFPSAHLYARAEPGEPVRALYLATPLLHALLAGTPARRMRLLSAGARVFVRQGQGDASRFRVLAEGLPVVRTWVAAAAVLDADLRALRALLEAYYPLCAVFAQPFRAAVERCTAGSHVARFPAETAVGGSLPHELLLPLWKSSVSVSLMLDKKAKSALSMRVFGEDVTLAAQAANKAKTAPAGDDTEMALEHGESVAVVVDDEVADADVDEAAAAVAERNTEQDAEA